MTLFDLEPVCSTCGGTKRVPIGKSGDERPCPSCTRVDTVSRMPAPDVNPAAPAGIESRADEVRLNAQQLRVWEVMKDGAWHTLAEIAERTGDPEASVSARFRDLRKRKYGGNTVERDHVGDGLYRYRLVVDSNGGEEVTL